jgi:hypothetical protein
MRLVSGPALAVTAAIVFLACGETQEVAQTESPRATTPATPTASSAPTTAPAPPTPTADDVPADWQTYTDPELGFSLEYPPGLVVEDLSDPTSDLSQRVLDFRSEEGQGFAIVVANNPDGLSVKDWAAEYSTCVFEKTPEVQNIDVDGNEALKCTGEPFDGKFEAVIVISRSDKIVYITSTVSDRDFDTIMSSFEFTS